MINPVYEKLAKIVVKYSLEVKEGNFVVIVGPTFAKELFHALQIEILKAGAHIDFLPQLEGAQEIFFQQASEKQLLKVSNIEKVLSKECDRLVEIRADYNTRKLSNVDPQQLSKYMSSPERKEARKIFEERSFRGELKWLVVPFPCQAYAQEANMDLFTYSDFVSKSLFLDKDNPIEEW